MTETKIDQKQYFLVSKMSTFTHDATGLKASHRGY